jgi:FSR family fosmidomycin resistance protein-like MFS transporter
VIGVLGDTRRRRAVLVAGGLLFALSAALNSAAIGFWTLLIALLIGNPATGAFVSLSQATLMDLGPARRERNMAWWTLSGSFGYVGGPLLLAAGVTVGLGWRGLFVILALLAVPLAVGAPRLPPVRVSEGSLYDGLRTAMSALRRREVLRWLLVLEVSDLMLDVLHGFLALYLVDVAGVGVVDAGLGVAAWTGAGLVGDALLIPLLARVPGRLYLRVSAAVVLVAYPAFLLAPGLPAKLVLLTVLGLLNSGWYAIPKAGLYSAVPGRSGTAVAVGGGGGILGSAVPAALGALAGVVGLGATMWLLILAPLGLLVLVPRR